MMNCFKKLFEFLDFLMNNNNILIIISIDEYSQIKKSGRIRIFDKRIAKNINSINEDSFFKLMYQCPDVGLRAESYVLIELKKINKINKHAFIDIQHIENAYAFNDYAGQLLSLPCYPELDAFWNSYLQHKISEDSVYKGELFLKLNYKVLKIKPLDKYIKKYQKKFCYDKLSFCENIILPNPEINGLFPEESKKFENCKCTYSYGWKAALTILRRLAIEYIKKDETQLSVVPAATNTAIGGNCYAGSRLGANENAVSENDNQNHDILQPDNILSSDKTETGTADVKVDLKSYWKIKDVRKDLENIRKNKYSGPLLDDFYNNEVQNLDYGLKLIKDFPEIPVAYLAIINHYGHFASIGKNFELFDFRQDLEKLDMKFRVYATYLVGQCMQGKKLVELFLEENKLMENKKDDISLEHDSETAAENAVVSEEVINNQQSIEFGSDN